MKFQTLNQQNQTTHKKNVIIDKTVLFDTKNISSKL